ncbi:MAG: ribosome recycling factor [Bacteroidetes bacterium]|jgi:ribosome recycling factor|nr:ribosome recycling factor [Bacteroidota bacterium]
MEEELEMLVLDVQDQMEKAIGHFKSELLKIRAGKASPELLNGIMVEAYGAASPLHSVASVSVPDARSITVQPFDRGVISNIERAIINSNIGLTPMNDGQLIRLTVPALTQERRQQLVKMVKGEMEVAKVSVRNVRKDANEQIKKMVKEGLSEDIGKGAETEVQNLTNEFNKKIEELFEQKEKDILTI